MVRKKGKYNLAVVGVGTVGIEMLKVLHQRKFPIDKLTVLARSKRDITVDSNTYSVKAISEELFDGMDIALFAGTEGEKGAAVTFGKIAASKGVVVIDNGADFRMDPDVPLIIPEVNPEDIEWHKNIIANPNCSTIQMVVALAPIHKLTKIRRIIVSTYQSVSGTGREAIGELKKQVQDYTDGKEITDLKAYPYQIAFNAIPHIGSFGELGYTTEEWKMVKETHKILHDDTIEITATTVRVPVFYAHSESIYIETEREVSIEEITSVLKDAQGISVVDDINADPPQYPMPIFAEGKDDTYVGRIRKDPFKKNGINMWVVSDNIRKGAALNAVQIAEELIR
ncbi:MAG: aspartate-semialdehyde dehydrogenase [bacterium]|nr:aspartate-semialdehyde dehydrogenase [bacterium]